MKKIALALVLIAVLALSLVSCGGFSTPEDAAKKAVETYLNFNFKEYDSYQLLTTEQQMRRYAETKGISLEDYLKETFECSSVDEYFEKMSDSMKKEAEENVGKFTFEITNTTAVSYEEDELKNFKDKNKDDFASVSIDTEKIQDAAKCTVKVNIKSDKGTEEQDFDVIVVKYDGNWKIFQFD